MDYDSLEAGHSDFTIYEVEWYYSKKYCRSMAEYHKPIILRFDKCIEAFDKFQACKADVRVWQCKYRTIHCTGFVDLNNNYIFTEKDVRETHWINPNNVSLC